MYAKTVIIGRLTKDVESRQVNSGGNQVAVANFPVAADHRGNTTYYDVVAWRATAENCAKFLGKGRMVAVEGHMERRSYQNQAGANVYVWELIADDVRFLDSNKSGGGQGAPAPAQNQNNNYQPTTNPTGFPQGGGQADPYAGGIGISDDNLPF